jgi:hypothetical protein
MIVGFGEAREKPEEEIYQIEGAKGKVYVVSRSRGVWSCPCTGFGYRRSCSHVVIAKAKSEGIEPPANLLKTKAEKKFKKNKNSCLLNSGSAVQSKSRKKRGNPAPSENEVIVMAKVTKTQITIGVMNANADKPMAEVVLLIAKANKVTESVARGAYRWCVNKGLASGSIESGRSPKASAVKATVKRMAKEVVTKTKTKATPVVAKQLDEIAKIKEANLARMKEVSAKLKSKKVRDFGDRVAKDDGEGVADFDPHLAREEVNSILRDERLIDVCPKFVREDA